MSVLVWKNKLYYDDHLIWLCDHDQFQPSSWMTIIRK